MTKLALLQQLKVNHFPVSALNTSVSGLFFNELFWSVFSVVRNKEIWNCVFLHVWSSQFGLKPFISYWWETKACSWSCSSFFFLLPHSAIPGNQDVRRSGHLWGSDSGCPRLRQGDRPVSYSYRESHRSRYESSLWACAVKWMEQSHITIHLECVSTLMGPRR